LNAQVEVSGLSVTFGGIDVVSKVDLTLQPGEIHAVVGENGAGKSSLGKAIAGVYRSTGSIRVGGQVVKLRSPADGLARGIALIHQEPMTFPDLTVAENVFVGHVPKRRGLVDWKSVNRRAQELFADLGVTIDVHQSAAHLSVAQQQFIELAAALSHDSQVWIFDETTAPLTPKETRELFAIFRRLRDRGCAVMFVTHHLQEVFEVADRITVLRDGVKVAERAIGETSPGEVVQLMVGRALTEAAPLTGPVSERPLLELKSLTGPGFSDVSLQVRPGEILGIAGLVGSGRSELARVLAGVVKPLSGELLLDGTVRKFSGVREAVEAGIALVPEDRRRHGLFLTQSVEFNATIARLRQMSRFGWMHRNELAAATVASGKDLSLCYRSPDQAVGNLSGGNQQKVVLGRWLMTQPRLLILDEPTRGVDVGAKAEVHRIIKGLAEQGTAILAISSDLPEVLALSTRIGVMRQGRLVKMFDRDAASERAIMAAATGEGAP
jgi:ABC-type sugar transport system ATPase subunit